ncbi:MAG: LPP20 family lipoprotein [Selenomonadaceae bacterium]|nr:LPP20 family lipoprotein [Selenomonadaceae bacterium]
MCYVKMLAMVFTIAAFIGVNSLSAFAAAEPDWANKVIQVTGMGAQPANAVTPAQARMLARRAAVADAYRQLAESIKGVNVDAETTVENMMVLSDTIKTKVNATIQGAVVVSEKEIPGGGYEVTMQVPIFGVQNSVASAVMTPSTDPTVPTVPETFPAPTVTVPSVGGYTGLIIDCRGLGLKPVMSPVIKNNSGVPIYGHKNLNPDKVIAQGMADYTYDTNTGIARAGSNPLIVKAVSIDGNLRGNPVVSTEDANKILTENNISHFLENTNVVFVR